MKIEIRGLNKIYPNGNQALKDINLEFGPGMFGLLGLHRHDVAALANLQKREKFM